jgi:hypothetical protein
MTNIAETVKALAQERSRMAGHVRRLDDAISVLRKLNGGSLSVVGKSAKKRTMSDAGRRKIAAAQRARWAKWKAKHIRMAA